MKRSAGILLPITSLPSPYGIGTMGKSARDFVDFLVEAKQTYWQILPIGPTGYGDSPYSSFSSYAGNPYMIDLDDLAEQGLLKKSEYRKLPWGDNPEYVDYEAVYNSRFTVLRKAASRLIKTKFNELQSFIEKEEKWLQDYALYMAIKDSLGGIALEEWPEPLRRREETEVWFEKERLHDDVLFYEAVQFMFFDQWSRMKKYANEKGIKIIGDLPIYAAKDSADVWASADQFQLNRYGRPKEVAGVPPDAFSEDGQLWGNPLYDWKKMKKDNYSWWFSRIAQQLRFYDVLRIDHFRGFESYFAIPAGDTTAKNGKWKKGPGAGMFKAIENILGKQEIIAEDLGVLTPAVYKMLAETGYPGMKVLQFAFDGRTDNEYLPHNHVKNSIVYVGTHDNDTVLGWLNSSDPEVVRQAKEYLHLDQKEGYNWGFIRAAYMSCADVAVITMQDLLGIGSEGRINTPSTLGFNWQWRYSKKTFDKRLANKIAAMTVCYDRAPKED
ncbi:MAG: 4-alpha-glucanotransferase [Solobacterium sp.]|nr:4-alpha-glucanotransferase [Solobacterium sp.]